MRLLAEDDPKMDLVKKLGRRHSATLGWFPNGAYEEHAAKGHLVIAENISQGLAGYVAFRVSKGRAMIAHLCVPEASARVGELREC